jgi:hypothetical protein
MPQGVNQPELILDLMLEHRYRFPQTASDRRPGCARVVSAAGAVRVVAIRVVSVASPTIIEVGADEWAFRSSPSCPGCSHEVKRYVDVAGLSQSGGACGPGVAVAVP